MKKLSICALTAALALFQFHSAHAKAVRAGSPTLETLASYDVLADSNPSFPDQGVLTHLASTPRLAGVVTLKEEGSSSTSSSGGMIPYRSLVRYLGDIDADDEVFSETSEIRIGTANSDTSSVPSSSTSSSGLSTTPISYIATTEFGASLVGIRQYLPAQNTWELVHSIEDQNLFTRPFDNWQEPLSLSTSAQGPQVAIAWINSLQNVVRASFYDGESWTHTDFPTADPVLSVHASVSTDGKNALVAYITQKKIIKRDTAQQNTVTLTASAVFHTGGTWSAQATINSGPSDPKSSPRIRALSGSSTQFVAFNSGQPKMTVHSSTDGVNWSQLGDSLPADHFNYGPSGPGDSGHLMSASIIDSGKNIIGRYYTTSPSGTELVTTTLPPLNMNFIDQFLIKGLSLGFNSMGHLMTGLIGDATNIFQTSFSGLASTFLQPAKSGQVSGSLPGIFAPTASGLGTPSNALNDLSDIFSSFAPALGINTSASAKNLSSYVAPPILGNTKYHAIITELENDVGELISRIEILRGLSTTDSLSRFTQFSTSISQKGGTFSP